MGAGARDRERLWAIGKGAPCRVGGLGKTRLALPKDAMSCSCPRLASQRTVPG